MTSTGSLLTLKGEDFTPLHLDSNATGYIIFKMKETPWILYSSGTQSVIHGAGPQSLTGP